MNTMNTSRYGLMSRATQLSPSNHSHNTQEEVPLKIAVKNVLTRSLSSADVEEFAGRSPPACNPTRTWANGPFFCAPSCRTISSARRLTVLPRPRTSRSLPMSRWPYRPHRSDACNEVDKAHVCAQSVHSRTLIMRSGARTEFPELLYAATRFLATSQLVATRYPNASQRTINSGIKQRFIHTLTV